MTCEFCGLDGNEYKAASEVTTWKHSLIGPINTCVPCLRKFEKFSDSIIATAKTTCLEQFEILKYKEYQYLK